MIKCNFKLPSIANCLNGRTDYSTHTHRKTHFQVTVLSAITGREGSEETASLQTQSGLRCGSTQTRSSQP